MKVCELNMLCEETDRCMIDDSRCKRFSCEHYEENEVKND